MLAQMLTCNSTHAIGILVLSCSTRDRYVPALPAKIPIAPMGKCLVDMSISILIFYDGCSALNYRFMEYAPSAPETSKVPIAPMGNC